MARAPEGARQHQGVEWVWLPCSITHSGCLHPEHHHSCTMDAYDYIHYQEESNSDWAPPSISHGLIFYVVKVKIADL